MSAPEPAGSPRPKAHVSGGRLLRSTGLVGAMTLLSRILGLVRDVVYARFFGASLVMDAFFVAFRIPNIFRRFFAEGSFSQAFVPVFAEYDEGRTRAEVQALIDRTAGTLGAILLVITLAGILLAPVFVLVFAPGFLDERTAAGADRYTLTVDMLRWTFPYLLFISLAAMAGSILNTYHRYAAAGFSPVLLNVVLIAFAAWVAPLYDRPGMALAAGVFAAGVVQLLFMLPSLLRLRLMPRPRWGWSDLGVRRILGLMVPGLFGSSVAQISILLDTLIASFLVTGSISWLYYADRLMEFPLGVFGIALATVILPNLSRQHATGNAEQFGQTLDFALRIVVLVVTPASLGIALLSGPMLATLFYGGRFSAEDVTMAAACLVPYALGLIGFTLVKVLAPGYFARQDTRTPVRVGLTALGFSMSFNILVVVPWALLQFPVPHAGLAAATALGGFLNSGLLYRGLRRGGIIHHRPGWARFLVRIGVASGVMCMLLWQFTPPTVAWIEAGFWERCAWLTAAVGGAALAYFATLFATGMRVDDLRMHHAGTAVAP